MPLGYAAQLADGGSVSHFTDGKATGLNDAGILAGEQRHEVCMPEPARQLSSATSDGRGRVGERLCDYAAVCSSHPHESAESDGAHAGVLVAQVGEGRLFIPSEAG